MAEALADAMKAIVVRDPVRDRHNVYLYVDGPRGRIAITLADGLFRYEDVPEGGEMPVAISLPSDGLQAIVDAATKVLPVDVGMAAALDDTRAVRDRLLTLVEHAMTRGPVTIVEHRHADA